jgi:hypothetical protein
VRDQEFWGIVGAAREAAGSDVEARVTALERELNKLPLGAVQAFQVKYDEMIRRANRWDLWGAAYLMNGGCSDDGFRYFCHWLISEGQVVFERALADPDSLVEVPHMEYFELEAFAYVALKVFESKGGGELERDFSIELTAPIGEEWEEEQVPLLFPRLAQAYGG